MHERLILIECSYKAYDKNFTSLRGWIKVENCVYMVVIPRIKLFTLSIHAFHHIVLIKSMTDQSTGVEAS